MRVSTRVFHFVHVRADLRAVGDFLRLLGGKKCWSNGIVISTSTLGRIGQNLFFPPDQMKKLETSALSSTETTLRNRIEFCFKRAQLAILTLLLKTALVAPICADGKRDVNQPVHGLLGIAM